RFHSRPSADARHPPYAQTLPVTALEGGTLSAPATDVLPRSLVDRGRRLGRGDDQVELTMGTVEVDGGCRADLDRSACDDGLDHARARLQVFCFFAAGGSGHDGGSRMSSMSETISRRAPRWAWRGTNLETGRPFQRLS